MVKTTFRNLSSKKQRAFTQAALQEFAYNTYNDASISRIVRTLGIAKGSFYQYFANKKALYLYLKEEAENRKRTSIAQAFAGEYEDFWELFRQLYVSGIRFDRDEPLYSAFLYRSAQADALPETATSTRTQLAEGITFFRDLLTAEQKKGYLKPNLDPELMAYTLMQVGRGIDDWLHWKYGIDFKNNLQPGAPVVGPNQEELLQVVDDMIYLLKYGMQHDPR